MVGFRGLGHDGGCRVPTLYVTRCRTHYPGRCARLQTECNSQTSNDRRGDGHYHLVNLFFAHNGLGLFKARLSFGTSLFERQRLRME